MLLIHVPRLTNRVGYTLNVVFHHILRTEFEITTDVDIFNRHEGAKLCYGYRKVGEGLFLKSSDLLFKTTIEEQNVSSVPYIGIPAIFPTYDTSSILPFDPLAAAFYCLSRYEEYLPHFCDVHGRFPATESIAYREQFLHLAVVDRWSDFLADKIKENYPEEHFPTRYFDFEDTFDIDSAYCYLHKGFARTVVGLCRDLFVRRRRDEVRNRFRVLFRRERDPFDSFDYVLEIHEKHPGIRLKFFPLMADYNVYDKPISYQNKDFRHLLQHLCDYAKLGLHGSYASHDEPERIAIESERLSSLLHRATVRNRYHFLRMTLPDSYNVLLDNGILHDYSMGYADEPGFRAGTGTPYPFFDLDSDSETSLMIHPFAVMDSTLYYYKKMSWSEAEKVYYQFIDELKSVGGVCSVLWHNQSLSECFGWQGWRGVYERVLEAADQVRNTK